MSDPAVGDVWHIGWVDLALLMLLLVSVLVGAARGLAYEVMSLLGWLVAYLAAQAFAPVVAPLLPIDTEGSTVRTVASFALVFIAALLAWSLLSWLVKRLVRASPLSPLDRLLGSVFGVLRGVLVALAVTVLVSMTPLEHSGAWSASRGVAGLQALLVELEPLLPEPVLRHLPDAARDQRWSRA